MYDCFVVIGDGCYFFRSHILLGEEGLDSYLRCSDYAMPVFAVPQDTFYVNIHDPNASDDNAANFETNSHGIAINQGKNIAVCNCEAYENTDHGFDISDWPKGDSLSHHITLENNSSYDNSYAVGFAINSDSHHILLLRNFSYRNYVGFMCYSGCGHLEYYHNVAMRNRNQGFLIDTSFAVFEYPGDNSVVFKNNIAFANDSIGFDYTALQVDTFNLQYEVTTTNNNLHVASSTTSLAHIGVQRYNAGDLADLGAGNMSKAPGFVEPTQRIPDIHLTSASEMIDAGALITINGKQESYNGGAPDIGLYEYSSLTTSVQENFALPKKFVLKPAYPNPFNPSTTIAYALNEEARIELFVVDLLGRKVKELVKGQVQVPGVYSVKWQGTNSDDNNVASGIYFVVLQVHERTQRTMKIVLVR